MTVEKILLDHDPVLENILPALKNISASFGYVSKHNAEKTAQYFNVPLSKVFETASFYDQVNVERQPDLVIKVCSGTNCAVAKSFGIIKEIEDYFGIKADHDSDARVRLEIISCLGQCGEGPIVIINDHVYQNVTSSGVYGILEEWS
jgi:NADH-quinone oxidoreductase subunit E